MKSALAIFGATGLTGEVFLESLAPLYDGSVTLFGSHRSVGQSLFFQGKKLLVQSFDIDRVENFSAVLLFTGEDFSRRWALSFCEKNDHVIDLSSAWRMSPEADLVIAGLGRISHHSRLIASPNCSTILPFRALFPLHQQWGLQSAIIASYQAVSGAGRLALESLENESQKPFSGNQKDSPFCLPIGNNLIPAIGILDSEGWSEEENAIENEFSRLLNQPIAISSTCVRVPISHGHSFAITASFEHPPVLEIARQIFSSPPFSLETRPNPRSAVDSRRIEVGRLRLGSVLRNELNLFLSADQLFFGAAQNAIQILQSLDILTS